MSSSFEFLTLIKESSYGVTMEAPTPGVDSIVIRLNGPNRFTPRPTRPMVVLNYGGGIAIPHYRTSSKFVIGGQLQTEFYASQADFILNWAMTRINSGRTTPWTTTDPDGVMPPGDLASVTAYHGIRKNDGTIKRRKYLGCKVHNLRIEGSDPDQRFLLSLDLQAKKPVGNPLDSSSDPDDTEFPMPADSDYPTDLYLFTHTQGGLTIDSVRSIYSSLNFATNNVMDARFFESPFIYLDQFRGRSATLNLKGLYKASPDDRANYEAIGSHDVSLVFNNGAITSTINMHGNNVYDSLEDDLPIDKVFEQAFVIVSQWDNAVHTDVECSVAAN